MTIYLGYNNVELIHVSIWTLVCIKQDQIQVYSAQSF
jgi:hypothetical protein